MGGWGGVVFVKIKDLFQQIKNYEAVKDTTETTAEDFTEENRKSFKVKCFGFIHTASEDLRSNSEKLFMPMIHSL